MRFIFFLLLPLVAADFYKETEDFQYSRTGDEGVKKGYYGAQSGNMGGNYEVAHNMDHLANHQMTNLKHQVGDQLGIDPLAIGSGHNVDSMNSGSLYGSASASGRAVHKGSMGLAAGGSQNSRTGTYSTAHGMASGGRTASQFSNYDANQHYDASESARRQSSSFNTENQQSGAHHSSSNKYLGAAGNSYALDRDLGERYSSAGRNQHNLHGSESYMAGTKSQQTYGAVSSGRHNTYVGSENVDTETIVQPIPLGTIVQPISTHTIVQPVPVRTVVQTVPLGSTLKLVVRPGQVVPIRVPIQASEGSALHSGYVQGSTYDRSDSQRRVDSHHMENQGASTASASHGSRLTSGIDQDRTLGTKGYESSYSYKKEWENHGSTVNQPITKPVVYTTNENTENLRDRVSAARVDNAQSSRSHDSSRTTYGTNYHAGRQNVAQSRDSKNTYVNWDENVDSHHARDNLNNANKNGYQQSSYSYNKEWESHGTPIIINQPKGESSTLNLNANRDLSQTSDRLYDAQHKSSEMSRTAESSSASLASSSQRRNYDRNQIYGAHSANHEQNYDESNQNLHTNIDSTHGVASQPKAYQSSYSYHKSWEKHGTPYTIYPAGSAITTEDLNSGSHASALGSHASTMDAQNHGSSWSTSSGQKSGKYSSSSSNSGASHLSSGYGGSEALSTDLERLQQQLKNKMSEMCTNCDNTNTKTKGYSASYSYSAQRGYGGSQDEHNVHRRKRKVNRSELSELDEYDNISIKNKVSEYEKWLEDVQELRKRVQNLKKKITHGDTVVSNEKKIAHYKGEVKSEFEIISKENTETEEEISELNDLRGKIESLRQRIQELAHPKTEDQLKNDIETISKKISDFDNEIKNKKRIPRNVEVEYLGQETEDLGQQTQDFGQLVDLGQQSEDLKGDFYLGQQTQDLGQQTEDLQSGSFYLGQQTEDLGQQSQDLHTGFYLGQKTEDLGQQTEDLHAGSFHVGQETQDSRNGKKYEGQSTGNLGLSQNAHNDRNRESSISNNNQQQTQFEHSRDRTQSRQESHSQNHHDTSEKDRIELDHIQLLQQSLNSPILPIYGLTNDKNNAQDQSVVHSNKPGNRNEPKVINSESPTQFRPQSYSQSKPQSRDSQSQSHSESESHLGSQSQYHSQSGQQLMNWDDAGQQLESTNLQLQSQSHSQSQSGSQYHSQSGQQLMDWDDAGQQLESTHLQLQDNSGHRLSFAKESEDFGQQLEQTEDLKFEHEGQVVEKVNVKPITHEERNPKLQLKQESVTVTSTEKPGFWKRVGNSAGSWFG